MRKLTVKQRKFVESYVGPANGNGTKAAALAGYKGNASTLSSVADENLRKPEIAAAVEERLTESLAAMGADECLERLSQIARDESPTARTADRIRALELLCRYHGLLKDRPLDASRADFPTWKVFVEYASRPIEEKAARVQELLETARARGEALKLEEAEAQAEAEEAKMWRGGMK